MFFLPKEVCVRRLLMYVRRLLMHVRKLQMYVRRLLTKKSK